MRRRTREEERSVFQKRKPKKKKAVKKKGGPRCCPNDERHGLSSEVERKKIHLRNLEGNSLPEDKASSVSVRPELCPETGARSNITIAMDNARSPVRPAQSGNENKETEEPRGLDGKGHANSKRNQAPNSDHATKRQTNEKNPQGSGRGEYSWRQRSKKSWRMVYMETPPPTICPAKNRPPKKERSMEDGKEHFKTPSQGKNGS